MQKPADFSLGWILKNPMAIMMVVMVLFVFILPKMIDPESMKEMQKEMQQMQQQQRQASPSPSGGASEFDDCCPGHPSRGSALSATTSGMRAYGRWRARRST